MVKSVNDVVRIYNTSELASVMGWIGPPHGFATCACCCLVGRHEWLLDMAATPSNTACNVEICTCRNLQASKSPSQR
jgi:hypothetical protein